MIPSKHTIIIIRNIKNEYLQYYDTRWNSYLFLNTKVTETLDEKQIKEELQEKLNVPMEKIILKFLFDKIHSKYSESAKKEKTYHHYFYEAEIKLPEIQNFTIKDIEFKYFSKDSLEKDEKIMKINGDIIGMINSYYAGKAD